MITFSKLGQMGRLGNQLFQIAATIGIANRNGQIHGFPDWEYSKHFKNSLPVIYPSYLAKVEEKEFYYTDYDLPDNVNWDLHGYFQSWKYFDNCKSFVRYYFDYDIPFSDGVAVHVRRGDFLERSNYHTNLGLDYYLKAMELFEGEHFTIFSDDIEWCKIYLRGWNVSFHHTGNDIDDLKVMSGFRKFIIANSSYSWWAAWLSGSDKVIAPKHWFEVPLDTKDLYLPEWIKL